jgi:hypothetical protein
MKVLGTIKRGRVKVRSAKQMRYLHVNRIDHTHFVRKGGKLRKVRHTY